MAISSLDKSVTAYLGSGHFDRFHSKTVNNQKEKKNALI